MTELITALGEYQHAQSFLDGTEPIPGYTIQPVTVRPIIGAYRQMIRDLAFDVSELAPVTYLMAREAGVPLVALPIFLSRRFHHADIQCGPHSGVRVPRDLEGQRVGVRAYSVSTGVWGRGLLADDFGVDLSSITWVTDDEDHVQWTKPENVVTVTDGRSLGEMLEAGDLSAAFTGNAGTGRAGAPRDGWTAAAEGNHQSYPLFADARVSELDWYERTAVCPLHSVVVVKQELVDADPELPGKLFRAFEASKRRYVDSDPDWSKETKLAALGQQLNEEPVSYGLNANRASIEALIRYSQEQGLVGPQANVNWFAAGDPAFVQ